MATLFDQFYYHKIIRKLTAAFGTLFNGITVVKQDKDENEIERIIVPLAFAQKEKYHVRITQDPNLTKSIQMTLPRMSYYLEGMEIDNSRKRQSTIPLKSPNADTPGRMFMGVPYDFKFRLSIWSRTIEEGAMILEQIVPIFNPQYTLSLNLVESMGIKLDVPVILDDIGYEVENSEGEPQTLRLVTWDLTFTVKAMMYGAVSTRGLIRSANTNIYDLSTVLASLNKGILVLVMNPGGTGTYKETEVAFQGDDFDTASVTAEVVHWDSANQKLYIKDNKTLFKANTAVIGHDTNAKWVLNHMYNPSDILAKSIITTNPANANANSDYTYTITISEYPDII